MDIIKFVPFHKKEKTRQIRKEVAERQFIRSRSPAVREFRGVIAGKTFGNIRKICPKTAFPDDCPSFKNFWCYNKDKASFSLVNKNKRKAEIK